MLNWNLAVKSSDRAFMNFSIWTFIGLSFRPPKFLEKIAQNMTDQISCRRVDAHRELKFFGSFEPQRQSRI